MIAFIGDVHRSFPDLERIVDQLPDAVQAIVQLGDPQLWPLKGMPPNAKQLNLSRPMFWLPGNWDYFPWLRGLEEPTEILPNAIYVPRGTVLELDGRKVACVGGAESGSEYRRTRGINWWPDEEGVALAHIEPLLGRTDIDILATHTPPAEVYAALSGTNPKEVSPHLISRLWHALGRPMAVSAHLPNPRWPQDYAC